VVGWLRPVILAPVGVLCGLAPEQVEALLAHELAHVRRNDYLVNVLQGIAERPAVLPSRGVGISHQIRAERGSIAATMCRGGERGRAGVRTRLAELESMRPAHFKAGYRRNDVRCWPRSGV